MRPLSFADIIAYPFVAACTQGYSIRSYCTDALGGGTRVKFAQGLAPKCSNVPGRFPHSNPVHWPRGRSNLRRGATGTTMRCASGDTGAAHFTCRNGRHHRSGECNVRVGDAPFFLINPIPTRDHLKLGCHPFQTFNHLIEQLWQYLKRIRHEHTLTALVRPPSVYTKVHHR